jgi:hypothetical protein
VTVVRSVAMLAADAPFPEWAAALGVPVWLGGLAFVLWLWLGGKVVLATDRDKALADHRTSCDAELAAVRSEADSKVATTTAALGRLQDRIDHLVVDRDAWREAHREEVLARQAAERAAAALRDTGQISLALLAALKDALAGRPEAG